jgi:hypothetical protein
MVKPDPARQSVPPARRPRWDRRDFALVCGAAIFVGTTLGYAGQSWAAALYQLLSDGLLLAVWLLGAAGLGAALLRPFLHDDDVRDAGVLWFVSAAAMGLGLFSLFSLGLGLAGLLNRATAWALPLGGLAIAVVRVALRGKAALRGAEDSLKAWLVSPAGWAWLWLAVLPLLSIAAVGALLPPGMLWHPDEPHGYDVVEYHLQIPREWYEAGRIIPLRHNVFSYFPFNVEMHYLLAMHLRGGPWKGMYLAQLMHVAYVVLSVLAVYGVAGRMRRTAAPGEFPVAPTLAAVSAAAVPWLTLLAPIGYSEGGLLLYGTLAVGWAFRAGSTAAAERRERLKRFALAGAFAGFACGSKLTAVPTVLLLVPLVLVVETLLERRHLLGATAAGVAVFLAAGLVTLAPWLVRNGQWASNPVFPQAARTLGAAHFTPVQVERWERAHAPPPGQESFAASLRSFGVQVLADWRFGFVLLPVALAAIWPARDRPTAWALFSMLMGLAGFWGALTHHQGRFFVLAVPVAALLLAHGEWGRWRWAAAVGVVVMAVFSWGLVHRQFASRLYGVRPWVLALGLDDLEALTPEALQGVPSDSTVVLVGEARTFWYQRDMRRLRYRTVFDVDTTTEKDVIKSWTLPQGRGPNDWLLVNPEELHRFNRTYFDIPPLPPQYKDRTEHFLIPPP